MAAKTIMVQGTMSNSGKSLVAAGLCRILAKKGYKTAPFKAQNMALNSYITADGLEMGRAQVMQAEAAGIAPDVRMNPVLLKPTSDRGSQVIVDGEVMANMTAREYYTKKDALVPHIKKAFDSLAEEYDVIVLEGAGSPAEINLREQDIVNMGMAKLIDSPVIIVGDIDRGGVFASLAGTMMLFDEKERSLVKGVLINKFRGDVTILEPGLRQLEEMIGVPVLGVVPYLDVDVDDEDSLSERMSGRSGGGSVEIAVVRLPRISNFTDFNVFQCIDGVSVRYVRDPRKLGSPDMVILPGTKNTIGDMKWMRETGMEAAVLKLAERGTPVFGVCGGYQMLGSAIKDECGAEGGGTIRGMGLLGGETSFREEKTRRQVSGRLGNVGGIFCGLSGKRYAGYEIHMGETTGDDRVVNSGDVYGSYIHGIFDSDEVSAAIVSALFARKGIDASGVETFDMAKYKEEQYDRLAEGLEKALDMEKIFDIIGIGGDR